jgi:predicted phage terminase large subunit-like protein
MSEFRVDIAGESLSYADFITACKMEPSWCQQWVSGMPNAALQNHLQWFWSSPEGLDSYVELPRGHTKTSTLVQRLAWEIGSDPDIRIKYVGVNDEEANKTSAQLIEVLKTDRFSEVFPGVVEPGRQLGVERFKVARTRKGMRDWTFEPVSVMGNAGGRADLLVFDDVCNLKNAVMQPAMRKQVIDYVNSNWMPIRDWSNESVGRRPPRTWRIGTPYHVSDITATWRERHGRSGTMFRRPVVDFRSPWPEVFTPALLRSIRDDMGPIAYARAYELLPVSSDVLIFQPEWIQRALWTEMPDHVRLSGTRIAAVDFAFTEKRDKGDAPDWSVLLIGRRSMDGHLWVERMVRRRTTFPEFVRLTASHCKAMGVRTIIAERSGAMRGLVQALRMAVDIPVTELERTKDKVTRACEVQHFVESGRFRVAGTNSGGKLEPVPELAHLVEEMSAFPAGDNDDCVDVSVDLMNAAINAVGYSGGKFRPSSVPADRGRFWRIGYG